MKVCLKLWNVFFAFAVSMPDLVLKSLNHLPSPCPHLLFTLLRFGKTLAFLDRGRTLFLKSMKRRSSVKNGCNGTIRCSLFLTDFSSGASDCLMSRHQMPLSSTISVTIGRFLRALHRCREPEAVSKSFPASCDYFSRTPWIVELVDKRLLFRGMAIKKFPL